MDSATFLALSSHATRLLLLLLRKFNGRNNGSIECSVREAAAWLHSSKDTAHTAFRELQERNLIAPVSKGHFTIKDGERKNIPTTWRLLFLPQENRT